MKVALLLFLFCLAEADDVRYEVNLKIQQLKSELEAQIADMASRPSASETKMAELQTRLSASETKMAELQTSLNQLQTSFDQLQDRHNLLTKEQDCLKKKLCEQDGFTFADGLCYYISTEKKTWDESRQWCRDRQSDLIVIKSQEKQDFVASFNKIVWLGLMDKVTEGLFQWIDGTSLTTPTYWHPGEPHYESKKYPNAEADCVEYYDGSLPGAPTRGWRDERCYYTIYWMCERALC